MVRTIVLHVYSNVENTVSVGKRMHYWASWPTSVTPHVRLYDISSPFGTCVHSNGLFLAFIVRRNAECLFRYFHPRAARYPAAGINKKKRNTMDRVDDFAWCGLVPLSYHQHQNVPVIGQHLQHLEVGSRLPGLLRVHLPQSYDSHYTSPQNSDFETFATYQPLDPSPSILSQHSRTPCAH